MYKVSRDYEKLFSMLCAGETVVGWADYVTHTSAEGEDRQRDVVQIRQHGEYDIAIGVRGLCYGSIHPFHQKNGSESSLLTGLCESLNLEWIEPTIPRTTVAAALRELRASVAAERSALFAPVLDEIDATIAKLGLTEETQ